MISIIVLTTQGQDVTLSGKVTDVRGVGIPSASVLVKGTKKGTATNDAGNFSISAKSGDI